MEIRPARRRRSALYVPAINEKALAKLPGLTCDVAILDLEDAVAPGKKQAARDNLVRFFEGRRKGVGPETIIRVNAAASEWGEEDLLLARRCRPDGILLPKVEAPRDILEANDRLDDEDARSSLWLWAMIETPRAMLNIGAIAELGRDRGARLAVLVVGANDLLKETGVAATSDRRYLTPWLMQIVLAARAGGLDVLDGVMNDFKNLDGFRRESAEARNMGFDGKTLIHPSQIEPANEMFSPTADEIAQASAIVAAFEKPDNRDKGVIQIDGRMVERLHLDQARRLLAKAGR